MDTHVENLIIAVMKFSHEKYFNYVCDGITLYVKFYFKQEKKKLTKSKHESPLNSPNLCK